MQKALESMYFRAFSLPRAERSLLTIKNKTLDAKAIAFIGMLGALSAVLMSINIPLPFAPTFLKFDIAEPPALFAGFFLGPVSGCAVTVVKIVLKLLLQGTETAFVGEFMNIVGSCAFVLPASLIYQRIHTKKGALLSLTLSTVPVSVVCIFLNAYIAFPMARPFVALSGMKGRDTLSTLAISVRGAVRNIGKERLAEIFEKNPYMAKIYPTEKSRDALEGFQIYQGEGEYFDLSQQPPFRRSFSFGDEPVHETGYRINPDKCIGCQGCRSACPSNCISKTIPRVIDESHCLHCGNCFRVCPVKAVEKLG